MVTLIHPCAPAGLDGDAELFQTLLMLPTPTDGEEKLVDITIDDILGPPVKKDGKPVDTNGIIKRDANLSLLTYSFNLNPALRRQLAGEIDNFQTDAVLTGEGGKAIDKSPAGMIRKSTLLAHHRSPRPSNTLDSSEGKQ